MNASYAPLRALFEAAGYRFVEPPILYEAGVFVEGELITVASQSPAYPMQFMLGIYAFPGDDGVLPPATSPREFVVDRFTAYRRDDG